MLVFFFCFYFLLFFFPLKLHVIDRTAAYTRSLLQLFPSVDLSRKKILLSSPPPLPLHPSKFVDSFFFLSFFFSFDTVDEIPSCIINSFLDSKRGKRIRVVSHPSPLRRN